MERLFIECAVRATLFALVTAVALWVMRIKGPAARHRTWTGVVVFMLALPLWTVWGPHVPVGVLPPLQPQAKRSNNDLADRTSIVPGQANNNSSATAGNGVRPEGTATRVNVRQLVPLVYLAGLSLLLVRLAMSMTAALRLRRRAYIEEGRLTSSDCATPVTIGCIRPVAILPAGWSAWPQRKLEAVLAHENEHVFRRDPLFKWLALVNRAVFWFHPLAWWLERQLVRLSEEACDAVVLERGYGPREYSEYLLDFARSVVSGNQRVKVFGLPMPGSSLPDRIQNILSGVPAQRVSRRRVFAAALFCTALAIPLASATLARGRSKPPLEPHESSVPAPAASLSAPAPLPVREPPAQAATAQVAASTVIPAQTSNPKFEVASIRPCRPGDGPGRGGGDVGANRGIDPNVPEGLGGYFRASPGRLDVTCGSLLTMIDVAYIEHGSPLLNNPSGPMNAGVHVKGVPKWAIDARYTIHAETDDPRAAGPTDLGPRRPQPPTASLLYGPMLQSLLEDRFHLQLRHVVEEVPMYALTLAKGGLKLQPMKDGDCIPEGPPGWPDGGKPPCSWVGWQVHGPNRLLLGSGINFDRLARELGVLILDRNVMDRTGITDSFLIRLEYSPDDTTRCLGPAAYCQVDLNSTIPPAGTISSALQELGLKLEPIKGPREHIVVDHVEPPSD